MFVGIWMSLLVWCGVLGLFCADFRRRFVSLLSYQFRSFPPSVPLSILQHKNSKQSKSKRLPPLSLTHSPPLFPSPQLHLPHSPSLSSFAVCVVVYLFVVVLPIRLLVCPSVCFVSFRGLSAYSFVYICLIVCVSFPLLALTQDDLDGSFTKYDIKRLDMYSRNLADYHLITDLILPAGNATWLVVVDRFLLAGNFHGTKTLHDVPLIVPVSRF